jgi:hypothetical protein
MSHKSSPRGHDFSRAEDGAKKTGPQKALYILCCFETSELRFFIRHLHDASTTAPGIRTARQARAFHHLNFRATCLINAAPLLTLFQSHRISGSADYVVLSVTLERHEESCSMGVCREPKRPACFQLRTE